MSEEVYTVEQFAERLKLHPKTVLRFIRDGRLRAVKVGKSYRIPRSEMEAMTGVVRRSSPSAARVTSIVDILDVAPALAEQLARLLPALRMGQGGHPDPMNLNLAYDSDRRALKIVIVGSALDTVAMLQTIHAMSQV
jgi:excisionase family DNA binding protein